MRHLFTILSALAILAAPAQAQTLKALMFNTNGQVIANTGTNVLTFTNPVNFNFGISENGQLVWDTQNNEFYTSVTINGEIAFGSTNDAAATRANLGLGATNAVTFAEIGANFIEVDYLVANSTTNVSSIRKLLITGTNGIEFNESEAISGTRANLGLGAGNIVTFAGLTNNGNVTIANTTATNGILFIRRTNNEPFLGLANLLASNNTTVSNETLFRVGVAEATNRSAQFGFRSTNTNGNGVAVFSVFGFNALMQIGADASTNAVIFSGGGTNNEVMTLIKNGATEFARPIAFSTTAHAAATRTNLALGATSDPTFRDVSVRDLSIVGGSGGKIVYPSTNTAPANTTNVVTWIQVNVGTNAYRVPLYQ